MHIATGYRSSLGPQNGALHPRYCDKTRAGEAYPPISARGRALPPPHDISGLIAWARREEWRDALATLIERHSAKACAGAGIAPEDIGDTLGEYAASNLFGAAFEDLLATDLPDGRNIADDYLRRRGWKESVSTREYIAGLRRSAISLYEVSGLVPGESMLLRDLVRGGDPVRVLEKSGSRGLRPWDRIATRIIPLRDRTVISGTLMVFERDASEAALVALARVREKAPRDVALVARELGIDAPPEQLADMLTPDMMLGLGAFLVTNLWLDAALKAAQGGGRPELFNSDGDPLELTTLHFPLLPGVTAPKLRAALAAIPSLRAENASFWNWLAEPGTKPKTVPRDAGGQTLISTMEDGSLVLGTLELKGRRLSLSVNSAARAERGRDMLEQAVAGLVRAPLIERADIDQIAEAERPASEPSSLSPEQERAMLHQMLEAHYRRVLDEPIPMLGGKSPRAAVKTAKGRTKVVDWLKTLENHSARKPGDPMGSYGTGWMWAELDLEDRRQ